VDLVEWDGLAGLPAFNQDLERTPPPSVRAFLGFVADADALLIATPEYNASVPGALKNALDWASRPFATNPLRGKPVAVISASTGSFGGLWAQNDLRRILGTLGARVIEESVTVPLVHTLVDGVGELAHPETSDGLEGLLVALGSELARVPVEAAA
jgi:chromate reductase